MFEFDQRFPDEPLADTELLRQLALDNLIPGLKRS
jgi:hypothetical protein